MLIGTVFGLMLDMVRAHKMVGYAGALVGRKIETCPMHDAVAKEYDTSWLQHARDCRRLVDLIDACDQLLDLVVPNPFRVNS